MGAEDFNLLPPQAWELQTAASAGLTISQFRFTLAVILSVVVGAILRKVPTVRGAAQGAGWGAAAPPPAAAASAPPPVHRVARSPGHASTLCPPSVPTHVQAAMCSAL